MNPSAKKPLSRPLRVLGIETSCDETAAAVVVRARDGRGRRILSNVVRAPVGTASLVRLAWSRDRRPRMSYAWTRSSPRPGEPRLCRALTKAQSADEGGLHSEPQQFMLRSRPGRCCSGISLQHKRQSHNRRKKGYATKIPTTSLPRASASISCSDHCAARLEPVHNLCVLDPGCSGNRRGRRRCRR